MSDESGAAAKGLRFLGGFVCLVRCAGGVGKFILACLSNSRAVERPAFRSAVQMGIFGTAEPRLFEPKRPRKRTALL
jgi:hypothetical protein